MDYQKLVEENKELQRQVAFLQKKYEMLFSSIDCAIWEYDRNTHLVHHEKKLPGKYENENLDIPDYRNTVRGWGIIHPDDMMIFEAYCDSMDRGDESFCYDYRTLRDDNTYTWQRVDGNTVRDVDGNIINVIGKTFNVDREYKDKEDLRMRACTDSLTGLLNKGAFQEELNRMITNGQLGKRVEFHAIYVMDIDNFKGINDNYGHLFGDYVLEEYANQIKEVFNEQAVIGRIGGDEFAVIVKGIFGRDEAEKYAKKLNKKVWELALDQNAHITTSIGIAIYPTDGREGKDIFQAADTALYNVKNHGKNGYAFYNETYHYSDQFQKVEAVNLVEHAESIPVEGSKQYLEMKGQLDELLDETYYYKKLMGNEFFYYVVEDYHLILSGKEKITEPCACYEQFGLKEPCKDCPIPYMKKHDKRYSMESFDPDTGKWHSKIAVRVKGKNGNNQYVVAREDVTRLVKEKKEADKLTGLMTISNFEIEATKLLAGAGELYCMVYLGYKDLNGICRQFGYKAGHEILKMTGKQLEYSLMDGEIAARVQDGDFVLLIKREQSVFDRVHMIMKVLQHKCNLDYWGSFSYMEAGVYNIENNTIPPVMAMNYAGYGRKSLYNLRKRTRNEFALFDETLEQQFKNDAFVNQNMYRAFFDDEFDICFIPVETNSGEMDRTVLTTLWEDRYGRTWKEEDYIRIFEERFFICEFNLSMYEKAFGYLQKWKEEGKKVPVLSLKIGYAGFWDRSFFEKLLDLMRRYDISHDQLRLMIEKCDDRIEALDTKELEAFLTEKGFAVELEDAALSKVKNAESLSPEEFEKRL